MPYVPIEWLREHVEIPAGTTAQQLAADLVRVGLEEEGIDSSSVVTGPLVVGRVLALAPEPQKNGKTINWCRVDVGPEHNDLGEADGGDPSALPGRGIVCGAPNLGVGDAVVVALPGTVLPDGVAIAARTTYGHVSDGMICSQSELGMGQEGDGIIVLPEPATPGEDAIELLGLGEEVLEINVTPDRGYCFSMRGVAREYGHSTGAIFTDRGLAPVPAAGDGGFAVRVADDAPIHGVVGCDRFVARVVRGIDAAAASPQWLQRRLRQAGMRPISLVVDITNYVMLDLGQPIHAYDLRTVHAPVVVRRARAGEMLGTLDGAERTLHAEDLLITDSPDGDGSRVIGLAGVMGGASTEVTDGTTDVLVEAAHFEVISIARTARRHKLPSEASKRFERGVDTALQAVAAQRVVDLLVELGGGTADAEVTDLDTTSLPAPIALDPELPTRLIGVSYSQEAVAQTLRDLGATVELLAPDLEPATPGRHAAAVGRLTVTPPTWRPDLTEPAELVEEVVRLQGYDQVPSILPRAVPGQGLTLSQRRRRRVADMLADRGLVQVLTYPFISSTRHDELGLAADDERRQVLTLANPLAQDAPHMRTGLLDTLLEAAVRNVGRGNPDVAIYEIGSVTRPDGPLLPSPLPPPGALPTDDDLAAVRAAVPAQPLQLAGVVTGHAVAQDPHAVARSADAFDAVAVVRDVAETLGLSVTITNVADHAPWHPRRCVAIGLEASEGSVVGYAGELDPRVVTTFGLPTRTVAFEVDLGAMLAAAPVLPRQVGTLSTKPAAKEDIALVVPEHVAAGDLLDVVRRAAGEFAEEVRLFDVYRGDSIPAGTASFAFALRLRGERTLTGKDTAAVRDAVVTAAGEAFGATLRS